MDLDSKLRAVSVLVDDGGPWRRDLEIPENPLTAAAAAMMSISGGEDGAAVLGLLYNYCKAPKERRFDPSGAKLADPCAVVSSNYGSLDVVDDHLQALRSMPVNLSLNKNNATAADVAACTLVKTEGHVSRSRSCSGGSYVEEPKDVIKMTDACSLRLVGYCSDSVCEDSAEEEMYLRSSPTGVDDSHCSPPADGFRYSLEASMSARPRQGEGPMAYLNRGQFYALTLSTRGFRSPFCQNRGKVRASGPTASHGLDGSPASSDKSIMGGSALQRDSVVQTVIMVVFSKDKCRDEQLKNWKYWHSHQHTAKQRVLDMADYKESFSTIGNVEEIAYNAVSFTWDITEEAKVFVSVNCLSTDFSSQKGVKGTPLIIQIDTYAHNRCSSRPIHRAFAQIKVFCDKGAERKLRDEEKKQIRKRMKGKSGSSVVSSQLKKGDGTLFKTLMDLESQPVLFIPGVHFGNLQRAGQVFGFNTEEVNGDGGVVVTRMPCAAEDVCPSQPKKSKVAQERKVLLYVRKEGDEVFDALMLQSPTLKALMEAISEKYAVPVEKMAKVYQKSKKGVLVNMDDNIIQHYSYEDTFILAIESSAESLRVTLSEI